MSRVSDKLQFHREPAPAKGRTLLELDIPSDLNLKFAYILRAVEALRAQAVMSPDDQKALELCLDEAIKNAIVWGNVQDPKKKVKVRLWEEDGRWGFTVSDQGQGFTTEILPDYDSEEFLWLDRGRGIYILLNYASEVAFHDNGRTLLVRA